jgi:hypothetical protein
MRPSSRIGRSMLARSRRLRVSTDTFHRFASSRLVNNESSVALSSLLSASLLVKERDNFFANKLRIFPDLPGPVLCCVLMPDLARDILCERWVKR